MDEAYIKELVILDPNVESRNIIEWLGHCFWYSESL
jgi:hypothetical protein